MDTHLIVVPNDSLNLVDNKGVLSSGSKDTLRVLPESNTSRNSASRIFHQGSRISLVLIAQLHVDRQYLRNGKARDAGFDSAVL
jgi:hypothetical protein